MIRLREPDAISSGDIIEVFHESAARQVKVLSVVDVWRVGDRDCQTSIDCTDLDTGEMLKVPLSAYNYTLYEDD